MNWDDLKDRFAEDLKKTLERLQENSLYIQIKDRYENLTPPMQKLSLVATGFVILFVLISTPMTYLSNSSDAVVEFEERRETIRELLKVSRESQDVPNIPVPPELNFIQSTAESQLQNARLLPEQIKSVQMLSESSELLPSNLISGGLMVSLAKLNLRQVIELGYQLQSISTSIKLKDLKMIATPNSSGYFDVEYKLFALNVPQQVELPAGGEKEDIGSRFKRPKTNPQPQEEESEE